MTFTIGVTGAAGFIGRSVCFEAHRRGYKVVALDRVKSSSHPIVGADETVLGDVRDHTSVGEFVAHVDGVIHLAGVLGTTETIADPRPATETNVLGGLNVLEACALHGAVLVNIGVGNHFEDNPYSISKSTVERYVRLYRASRGVRGMTVRALNAYGPGQSVAVPYGPSRVRKIVPTFVHRALDGMEIPVYGTGEQVMDMVHVQDVATALVGTLAYLEAGGDPTVPTPEVGLGLDTSVGLVAEVVAAEVARFTGSSPVQVSHLPMRAGETPGVVVKADPKTLEPLRPHGVRVEDFADLTHGIRETVAYYGERWTQR